MRFKIFYSDTILNVNDNYKIYSFDSALWA